jgi:hypothetical protein
MVIIPTVRPKQATTIKATVTTLMGMMTTILVRVMGSLGAMIKVTPLVELGPAIFRAGAIAEALMAAVTGETKGVAMEITRATKRAIR